MAKLTQTLIFVACAGALAGSAYAAPAKTFLKSAIEGDNGEVAAGKMAQQKGASQGVKDFGRMLETDHAKAKADAAVVARAQGVPVTDAIKPESKMMAQKLAKLSGPAFDHAFVQGMVKDHKKDIAEYEKQAKSGDKATAALAAATLPTLKKHLQVAEGLPK